MITELKEQKKKKKQKKKNFKKKTVQRKKKKSYMVPLVQLSSDCVGILLTFFDLRTYACFRVTSQSIFKHCCKKPAPLEVVCCRPLTLTGNFSSVKEIHDRRRAYDVEEEDGSGLSGEPYKTLRRFKPHRGYMFGEYHALWNVSPRVLDLHHFEPTNTQLERIVSGMQRLEELRFHLACDYDLSDLSRLPNLTALWLYEHWSITTSLRSLTQLTSLTVGETLASLWFPLVPHQSVEENWMPPKTIKRFTVISYKSSSSSSLDIRALNIATLGSFMPCIERLQLSSPFLCENLSLLPRLRELVAAPLRKMWYPLEPKTLENISNLKRALFTPSLWVYLYPNLGVQNHLIDVVLRIGKDDDDQQHIRTFLSCTPTLIRFAIHMLPSTPPYREITNVLVPSTVSTIVTACLLLEELEFTGFRFVVTPSDETFASLCRLEKLHTLKIKNCACFDQRIYETIFPVLPRVTSVSFENTRIDSAIVAHVFPNLQRLCAPPNRSLMRLAAVPTLVRLELDDSHEAIAVSEFIDSRSKHHSSSSSSSSSFVTTTVVVRWCCNVIGPWPTSCVHIQLHPVPTTRACKHKTSCRLHTDPPTRSQQSFVSRVLLWELFFLLIVWFRISCYLPSFF